MPRRGPRRWTREEEQELVQLYADGGLAAAKAKFPELTTKQIAMKRYDLRRRASRRPRPPQLPYNYAPPPEKVQREVATIREAKLVAMREDPDVPQRVEGTAGD